MVTHDKNMKFKKYNNMMVVKGMFQVIYVLSVDFLSV